MKKILLMLNVSSVHSSVMVLPPQESNYYYPHSSNQESKNQGTIYINNNSQPSTPQHVVMQSSPVIQPQVIIKEEKAPFYENIWFYICIFPSSCCFVLLWFFGRIFSDPDMKAALDKYNERNKFNN